MQKLKKILTIVTVFLLLVSTTGLVLVHTYCGCTNQNSLSILLDSSESNECNHCHHALIDVEKDKCASSSCCPSETCATSHSCASHENSYQYLVLNIPFFDAKRLVALSPMVIELFSNWLQNPFNNTLLTEQLVGLYNTEYPPDLPLSSGKDICIHFCSLKIFS